MVVALVTRSVVGCHGRLVRPWDDTMVRFWLRHWQQAASGTQACGWRLHTHYSWGTAVRSSGMQCDVVSPIREQVGKIPRNKTRSQTLVGNAPYRKLCFNRAAEGLPLAL